MNNALRFKNGKFKLMQITDMQEVPFVSPDTIKLISAALDAERPDIAVLTGDQIKGYSSFFKKNTLNCVDKTLRTLLEPLSSRGIPFIVTLGNHDCQCGISNTEQMKIYSDINGFISGDVRSNDDLGTSSFVISSQDGSKELLQVMLIDSQGNLSIGGYNPVKPEQIDWYKQKRDYFLHKNGDYLPTIVFQHIPVPEYYDALVKVKRGTKGAVQAYRTHANEYYVLPQYALDAGGFMHESPACPDENSGELAAMSECGDVMAIFSGHDHINSYVTELNGIDLGYAQNCGFNVYGPGVKRGVRIFDFWENNPSKYETHTLTYESLGLGKPEAGVKDFVLTHVPTNIEQVKPAIYSVAASLAVTAGIVTVKKLRKNKR